MDHKETQNPWCKYWSSAWNLFETSPLHPWISCSSLEWIHFIGRKGPTRKSSKVCLAHLILGKNYLSYENALSVLCLESLEDRRASICLKFALKAEKHLKFKSWFKSNPKFMKSRTNQPKYIPVRISTARIERSPIGYLTDILNTHYGYTYPTYWIALLFISLRRIIVTTRQFSISVLFVANCLENQQFLLLLLLWYSQNFFLTIFDIFWQTDEVKSRSSEPVA